jgi:hypothetical protein
MPRDEGRVEERRREGGMNNDPCMYHVSFLFNVGDGDEGGKTERSERRQACETRLDRRRLSRERGKGEERGSM